MSEFYKKFFSEPRHEAIFLPVVTVSLVATIFFPWALMVTLLVSIVAVLPTFVDALRSLQQRRISIDAFNAFAFGVSAAVGETRSAAFIALMLLFARILESVTESRMRRAVEELLKLKPIRAVVERPNGLVEIPTDEVVVGDVVIVRSGARVPIDGVVVHGEGFVSEAAVTGESAPVKKTSGDEVISLTLCETGFLKVRATRVGKDSTAERMVELMREAAKRKSHAEKLADRFAAWFLPGVLLLGAATYLFTRNWSMVAALFLVACADDMAVAIPLAVTAAMRRAAKLGVVVKSGRWLDALADATIFVFDKTGTLTFGTLSVSDFGIVSGMQETDYWRLLAVAEKYSDHPVGRAVFREAARRIGDVPDADDFTVVKGAGVKVKFAGHDVLVGNERAIALLSDAERRAAEPELNKLRHHGGLIADVIFVDGHFVGWVMVADQPRSEAADSLRHLREIGVKRIIMFTGDDMETAARVSQSIGMDEYRAEMRPEDKLQAVAALRAEGRVVMVGDGINDAPALAVADVGIAMGGGGTAVAVAAADIVVLTDRLDRLPEVIRLARLTRRVVRTDAVIWIGTNIIGFVLVLTGVIGPAAAALYNLLSDFLPLINSTLFFRERSHRQRLKPKPKNQKLKI